MGRTGEMLIDVTDGDTIKQVQLEEQIDTLMLRINELENKNKMLASEKLLIFVENKEQKAEIEILKRKNGTLKVANEYLRDKLDGLQEPTFVQTAINNIVDSEYSDKITDSKKFAGYMLMVMVSFLSVFLASVVYIRFFG